MGQKVKLTLSVDFVIDPEDSVIDFEEVLADNPDKVLEILRNPTYWQFSKDDISVISLDNINPEWVEAFHRLTVKRV